jgi:CheY-like chemotaxis protein
MLKGTQQMRLNIVLADYPLSYRDVLAGLLREKGGHTVTVVESERQALAVISVGERIDLIMLSASLPEMDLPLFLNKIREQEKGIRVIILTGDEDMMESLMEVQSALGIEKVIKKSEVTKSIIEVGLIKAGRL